MNRRQDSYLSGVVIGAALVFTSGAAIYGLNTGASNWAVGLNIALAIACVLSIIHIYNYLKDRS